MCSLLSILLSDVKPETTPYTSEELMKVKLETTPYTSEELMKVIEEQLAASAAAAAWNPQPVAPTQQGLTNIFSFLYSWNFFAFCSN
jgi:hypothetical protein